jgi:hypothetical protein
MKGWHWMTDRTLENKPAPHNEQATEDGLPLQTDKHRMAQRHRKRKVTGCLLQWPPDGICHVAIANTSSPRWADKRTAG